MQDVRALRSYAVYVVAYFRKTTVFKRAHLVFHEFFESVPGQLLILDVIGLVFFCVFKKKNCKKLYLSYLRYFERYQKSFGKKNCRKFYSL